MGNIADEQNSLNKIINKENLGIDLENIISRYSGNLWNEKIMPSNNIPEYNNYLRKSVEDLKNYAESKGIACHKITEKSYLKAREINKYNPKFFEVNPELTASINGKIEKNIKNCPNLSSSFQFSRIIYTLMVEPEKINDCYEKIKDYSYEDMLSNAPENLANYVENFIISIPKNESINPNKFRNLALSYLSLAERIKKNDFSIDIIHDINSKPSNYVLLFSQIDEEAKTAFFKFKNSSIISHNPIFERGIFVEAYYAYNKDKYSEIIKKLQNEISCQSKNELFI